MDGDELERQDTDERGDGDLGGLDAIGGLDGLLSQAMQMQQEVMSAQAAAAEQTVEGQAGGGAVRVRVTGGMVFEGVTIDPGAVDPDDVSMLEDLVLAAINDAVRQVNELQAASLGGFGDLLGSSGLGGMLGVGGPNFDDGAEDAEDAEDAG